MFISQDRKKFLSLEDAKKNIDLSGRRVAIINDDRVVTIRPHIVKKFPGTLPQLFQLGQKLGGYPLDVYKQRKRECEYRDETKELVFARTIAQLNYLAEKQHGRIIQELLNQLGLMTDTLNLWHNIQDQPKVSDYLLSFRIESEPASITGMEAFEKIIELFIVQRIGAEVAGYLKSNVPNELRVWINDRYSPFFLNKYTASLTTPEVYNLLLQHPDLQDLHNEIKSKVRNDFYNSSPQLLFVPQSYSESNGEVHESSSEYITEHKTEYINVQTAFSTYFKQKKWATEQIFEVFSKEQILYILNTYFRIINPIQVVHEMMAFSSMSKLFLKDHKHLLNDESVQQLEEFVQKMYPLKEYETKFCANPDILESHKRSLKRVEEELALHFELSMRTVHQTDGEGAPAKTWFKEKILSRRSLSWGEKGILAYAFFIASGKIDIEDLAESSNQSKTQIKKMIHKMQEDQILYLCNECSSYHMCDTKDFEWPKGRNLLGDSPLQSFEAFMYDDELSWEAKGLYTWMQCTDTIEPDTDLLFSLSCDPKSIVERAYQELFDQGYVEYMGDESYIEKQALEYLHLKNACGDWYQRELRPVLEMIFAADAASAELLNARYPSKYDLNAIQLATLADDGEMIQKLLQIEGLQMSDPFQKDQHPLLLGFRSGSHKAVTTLLKDIRISEQPELISVFFGNVIMDEVPADVLVSYLDAYNSDIKDELISKMLLPALMRKNKEIMEVLLKAGASPTAVIVDNKTAWDIAKEQEEVDIMLLFKRYL